MKKISYFISIAIMTAFLVSCVSMGNVMKPVMGETDMELMGDAIPIVVKGVEVMHYAAPSKKEYAAMSSMLYVMYANVFVQQNADMMDSLQYEKQYEEKQRAKMHYLRGKDYGLDYFNVKNKNFSEYIQSGDAELEEKALKSITKKDVSAAYWLGAGWLGAFALDPLNPEMVSSLRAPVLILEKAASLDPEYSNGAIWDVLCAFYAAAPQDFGGNVPRAVECFLKEVEITKGKGATIFMTYANTFCKGNIPLDDYEWKCKYSFQEMGWEVPPIKHDAFLEAIGEGRKPDTKWPLPIRLEGFDWALDNVLKINLDDFEDSKLTTNLAIQKAKFLKAHREDYFIVW